MRMLAGRRLSEISVDDGSKEGVQELFCYYDTHRSLLIMLAARSLGMEWLL